MHTYLYQLTVEFFFLFCFSFFDHPRLSGREKRKSSQVVRTRVVYITLRSSKPVTEFKGTCISFFLCVICLSVSAWRCFLSKANNEPQMLISNLKKPLNTPQSLCTAFLVFYRERQRDLRRWRGSGR